MKYNITVIPGDGIGPEVTQQAVAVLKKIAQKFDRDFNFQYALAGGAAIDETGESLPQNTLDKCRKSHGVLLGAVGGPKWDQHSIRPEQAILGLRKELALFANLRPAVLFQALSSSSPLKESVLAGGLDLLVVRELTGGIYFGERGRSQGERGEEAWDVERYSEEEIRRIAHVAFRQAESRRGSLVSVDKANVLESSRLWRKVVNQTAEEYPKVKLSHMYVDNAAMQLAKNPGQFDVILTGNLFGDILSDEASILTGSIGLLPSASVGSLQTEAGTFGLYEPIHGSAPDIAGSGKANPIAAILSAAMLLRTSLSLDKEAQTIEEAVEKWLQQGGRTADLYRAEEDKKPWVTTQEAGEQIVGLLDEV